jgi:two-component system response regulator AtoC
MARRVLIADSDTELLDGLQLRMVELGCEVLCAPGHEPALQCCERWFPDLVLWGFPDHEDVPGPGAAARRAPDACVVLLHDGDRAGATERAVRRGAHDILAKGTDDVGLMLMLHRTAERTRLHRQVRLLETEVRQGMGDRPIVAAAPRMIAVLEGLERANNVRSCLLLRGENGTGKEGLARAAHAQSGRRSGPFIPVHCNSGDAASVERELFGRPAGPTPARRGRFVEADRGTLYLDGVDALTLPLQERLLTSLETGQVTTAVDPKPWSVDVRVISATTRDLAACASAGDVLPALHERLAGIELQVPPLRERTEDIPLLVDHFLSRSCRELGKPLQGIADDALERLTAYAWPGNLRELRNVLENAVMLARGESLTDRDLPAHLEATVEPDRADEPGLGLRRARKRLEVELIRRALRRTGGNRTHAARLLEISHRALLYKLKEFDIQD